MDTANTTSEEPFDPRMAKELDRDLLNLHLPKIDLVATEEECAAMYPPGVYKQMIDEILGLEEQQKPA